MPYMVVVSDIGRERGCRDAVRRLGFACYMPTFREQVITRGRKVWHERLLFGRYFFAKQSPSLDWHDVMSLTFGDNPIMRGLFMRVDAQEPALIRDFEIDRIRATEDSSGHVTDAARRQFIRNQRVRAAVGVMAGTRGTYLGPGRGGCDVALIDLFGRETKIEFAPGVLQAA